jgi:anti-anti-sigma regulatory factor
MAQASIVRTDWDFEVERGPGWLFVRPRPHGSSESDKPTFAEQVWALLQQNFTNRLVLELGEVDQLDSHLVTQLLWLHKRVHAQDGLIRIAELSAENEEVLWSCGLEGQFPSHRNREDAVMCRSHPRRPR